MADVVFTVAVLAGFAGLAALLAACDRLVGADAVADPAGEERESVPAGAGRR